MTRDSAKADSKMKRKLYEQELHRLQIELFRLEVVTKQGFVRSRLGRPSD
jgi:hypothetical protein